MIYKRVVGKVKAIWLRVVPTHGRHNETNRTCHEIKIHNISDIIPFLYWCQEDEPLVMYLPTELLIMQGAFAYDGGWHPFVEALRYGRDVLTWYYSVHQPLNLREMYFLDQLHLIGEELAPWEMPWFHRSHRRPPPGECGLGAEHGVSFFGPASKEKVELEYKRLTETLNSIETKGHQPHRFEHIAGFFMRYEQNFRFFVRSGKHRAAVLSFMGLRHVPVVFRQRVPRCVDITQCRDWPLVWYGKCDPRLASSIFERYFEFSGREQLLRLHQADLPYPFDIQRITNGK